jgi:hypothetical protein
VRNAAVNTKPIDKPALHRYQTGVICCHRVGPEGTLRYQNIHVVAVQAVNNMSSKCVLKTVLLRKQSGGRGWVIRLTWYVRVQRVLPRMQAPLVSDFCNLVWTLFQTDRDKISSPGSVR